jgi:hypothetical protein
LPDELVARAPELARRVAAQVGVQNPAILKRVIRLVGVGALSSQAAQELESILQEWAKTDAGIRALVPTAPANTAELTRATRYLIAERDLDSDTARSFSNWLQTVATPRPIIGAANRAREVSVTKAQRQLVSLRSSIASIREGDPELADESADRAVRPEVLEAAPSLETLDQAVEFESIVLRRARPVFAIKNNVAQLFFTDRADSEIWEARLTKAKPLLEAACRAVGRINLIGGPLDWVGTGWLVAEN